MIAVSRGIMIGLAGAFSFYHVVLALFSLGTPERPEPVLTAIALYIVATVATLWPTKGAALPHWIAAFDLAVCLAIEILVTSQLDPDANNGYATWYVAAVGTLLTIVAVRYRIGWAWVGGGILVLHSIVWAGPVAVVPLGVVGSLLWVLIATAVMRGIVRASRETVSFAQAEREAADWHAAQDAHLYVRQLRVLQTKRISLPMLRRIVESDGDLDEEDRVECFRLEAALRDEIRGPRLLDDSVRHEIMRARRAGTEVVLLDDGGLDETPDGDLSRIHARIAEALRETSTEKLIIRTVQGGEPTAVTMVGLSAGEDPDDPDIDLWLEIPREAVPAR
ncbi:hypothetical protein [Naasia aerilata]|uniref:Uncharacterized protein n=1 Tax=Naasia aerilata TaxID=1162966 RepID=A0ABM8GCB8_9MICO|nr:hypothetical protein [Naasia aerilata]BDZ45871.1 hypothetical protein GCM10025866_17800 [Naasia aerilata]